MFYAKKAGKIQGNPLCGLCDKVCLDVRQIIDGSAARFSNRSVILVVSSPEGAVFPFSFESAQSVTSATVSDLTVSSMDGGRSRVRYTVTIPLSVRFADARGVVFDVPTTYSLDRDIVLTLPQDETYEIQVAASFLSRIGTFSSVSDLSVTACFVIVTRVVTTAQLLFPSYGACEYPTTEEFADSQTCSGVPDPRFL